MKKRTNLCSQKIFVSILLLFGAQFCFGQITVNQYGNVKLADELNINHYLQNITIESDANNSASLGSASIRFSSIHGTAVYAYNYFYNGSDSRIKENFREIEKALPKILQMKGKKYDFIVEGADSTLGEKLKEKMNNMSKNHLGFIAQELQAVLPEAVYYDEEADKYYIEYNAIIPVIVEAMKEQQTTIDALTDRIEKLEGSVSKEKSAIINESPVAFLKQNIPNPFTTNTTINMYLPNKVSKAVLYIYTMQGEQIKKFTINERGNSAVTIEGHSFKAGMYLYTLVADGKEVDTKKMILTK